ncbi:type II secretion system F family protein [Candidatus Parcubacteria bacterium]|nr:type II secretion system F family protein [Candidatus Parcubacteria bacterium]
MPTFTYEARTLEGQVKTGTYEAASASELARALRAEGYLLVSVKVVAGVDPTLDAPKRSTKPAVSWLYRLQRVKLIDKVMLARHLGVMVGAGLSLNRALNILALQTTNPVLRWALGDVAEAVNRGETLADALGKHPKLFNDLFVNMVRVGETAGSLEEVLKLIARQLQKDYDLSSRVRGAMVYPAVILAVMFIVGGVMMVVVVPKLVEVFQDLKVDLPITTRIIIGLSSFLQRYWYIVLTGLVASIVALRWYRRSIAGKRFLDRLWMTLPVIGGMVRKVNVARFARTFGSLVESGVSVVQALNIVSNTLTNHYYRQSLAAAAEAVVKGRPVSEALGHEQSLYPPLVTQMLSVGEETGATTEILHRLALFYEAEVTRTAKNLSTVIEPALMVVIGAAVGLFAISMIQPMYSLVNSL